MATDPHIGTRISKRRHQLRMTQEGLAAALGVSKSTVANWESGKHYPLRHLGALEEVLGIVLDDGRTPPDNGNVVELRPDREAVREIVHHALNEYDRRVVRREAREIPDSS